MDRNVNAGEVEDGGQDSLQCHLSIGNSHVLSHQEGSSAHDGGHDLTAGGGSSLNGAGKLRLIARLLHHGDGDGAGGHSVAHGGAGHHAAQSGGDNGYLGGAAGGRTGHGVCQINKEVGNSGAFQEGAENNKHNNVGGTHLYRSAHHAAGGIEQVIDDLSEPDIGKGVNQQSARHTQNGQPYAAAAQLRQRQYTDDGNSHHEGLIGYLGCFQQDILGVGCKVEEGACAKHHDNQIIPRDVVYLHISLFHRIVQVTDDKDQTQEHGQTNLQQAADKQSHDDTVQGKERHDGLDHQLGLSFPNTGVGLTVIFFHDLVHCVGNVHVRFHVGCSCLFLPFFFVIHRAKSFLRSPLRFRGCLRNTRARTPFRECGRFCFAS